ncbi:unnamed protein product, partial [Medioppia subpectinata]
MWSLSTQNRTNVFIKQFNKHWKPIQNNKTKNAINIFPLVLKTYWPTILFNACIQLVSTLLTFTQPLILDRLITFMTPMTDTTTATVEPIWRGYLYAGAMFVSPVLASVLNGQYDRRQDLLLMKMRSSVTALGAANLVGLSVLVLLIPFNSFMITREHRLWAKILEFKDKRVAAITEIINHIKVLKLYGWEPAFMNRVFGHRAQECAALSSVMVIGVISTAIVSATPYLVSLCSFTAFLYMSDQNILDPNKAFVSLLLFNILNGPITKIPPLVTCTILCRVSVKRMNSFLNANEVNESFVDHKPNQRTPIIVKNGSFKWDNNCNDSVLKNINIEIESQSLVAVVGRV